LLLIAVNGSSRRHASDILGLINTLGLREISEAQLEMAMLARQINRAIRLSNC